MTPLPPLDVLYEDNHCLVVNKPAGVLSMGDQTDDQSILEQAKLYVKQKYNKPGEVYLGVVHRLDRPTSGVLLFARTSKAAGRLSAQLRERSMRKIYHAIVEGVPAKNADTLVCHLLKDRDSNLVRIVSAKTAGAKSAELEYELLETKQGRSRLRVEPHTGRSHQIRVQLGDLGTPIVGDAKYGASRPLGGTILLHASSLEFDHPTQKQRVVVEAPLPDNFRL